jgi:arylmalonate decarboxylase
MEKRSASWRARLGTIIPVSNTTNEIEFNQMKPDGVTVHFTRVPLHGNPAEDDFKEMLCHAGDASKELAAAGADVIAYGCTSGSMICPADKLIGEMEKASGKPSISTAGSILEALKNLGVKRLSMATPYSDATNEKERAFIEGYGFQVLSMKGLGLGGTLENIQKMSRVAPSEIFTHAKSVDSGDSEAVLICCTDFGSASIVEDLEKDLGKPVITSNTASFWGALRRAGVDDVIEGFGRLLHR